jgi:fucose 4-O-acetylase-like acetyltransferase
MWFLYCLFLATVLFTMVRAVGRRPAAVMAGVVVLSLAATFAAQRIPDGVLTLNNLGWLLPFLAAGYYGCVALQRPQRFPGLAKAGFSLLALVLLWIAVGSGSVGAAIFRLAGGGQVASLLSHSVRYALAAAGIASVWHLIRLVPRIQPVLSRLGIATLGIYALNSPALTLMRLWFPTWSAAAGPALTVLTVVVAAAIVLGVEWIVTLALERTEITRRVLLGRWPSRSTVSGT